MIDDLILVQAQGVDVQYQVDLLNASCSCGHNTETSKCFHFRRASELKARSKNARFDLISALHKAIRTSDLDESWYWAKLLRDTFNRSTVTSYIKSIITEETVNVEFFISSNKLGADDFELLVKYLCLSTKYWESVGGRQAVYDFVYRTKYSYDVKIDDVVDGGSFRDLIGLYYFCKDAGEEFMKDFGRCLYAKVVEVDKSTGLDASSFVIGSLWNCNSANMFILYASGLLNDDDFSYRRLPLQEFVSDDKVNIIRRFPDYIYDIHTHVGKKRLVNNIDRFSMNASFPSSLDLRFSGQCIACYWRCLASEQFHNVPLLNIKWEDVKWNKSQWHDAWLSEKFFYNSTYSKDEVMLNGLEKLIESSRMQ